MVHENIWEQLIPEKTVQQRIDEMTPGIQEFIDSCDKPVVMAIVALGGTWFGMELVKRLKPESFRQGLVGTSSYGGAQTGRKVT